MFNWFDLLLPLDRFFLLAALAGTMGVGLRLLTQFLGLGGEAQDGGGELGDGEHHVGDGFKIISFHGLSAFLMMFGLVGFAVNRGLSPAASAVSVLSGLAAGVFSVWLITKLFNLAYRLQSVGNLDINKAAGCGGTVYLQIPKGGTGRVVINVCGRQREMDAVHADGEAVATGTKIVVLRMDGAVAVVASGFKLDNQPTSMQP